MVKLKHRVSIFLSLIVFLCLSSFLSHVYKNYKVQEKFAQLPLNFNPTNSVSVYNWNGAYVKIQGGFIKGKISENRTEDLLLRSLSPTPIITIKGSPDEEKLYHVRLENINPANTILTNVEIGNQKILDIHTVLLILDLKPNEERIIQVLPKGNADYTEFVILGDNRNGYDTFSQIIQQINSINPAFVIDNGDLVFGGEPNRYRLFYETVSKLQVPLYTTLGNHDIRKNGRPIYTMLFGPPYYSFNYKDTHLVFLDSSRGWAEKQAIPDEQYIWLENDLKGAVGKKIYVISHVPPVDPRVYKTPNDLPDIPNIQKTNAFERMMDDYNEFKSLNHGFPTVEEAQRFETLMSKYNVNTVFTSHIHSYFSYVKDNVRYIISGGGGAELLTPGSFYHYLRVKITDKDNFIEMVELPSPVNTLQDRYIAAGALFASSTYKEYTTLVIAISSIIGIVLLWILYNTREKWWPLLVFLGKWIIEVLKFARDKFKEMRNK